MTIPTPATLASTLQRLLDAQRNLDLLEDPGPGYSADTHERAVGELSIAQFAAENVLREFYGARVEAAGITLTETGAVFA